MKKKLLFGVPAVIAAGMTIGYQVVFSLPEQPQLSTITNSDVELALRCYDNPAPVAIDDNGRLNILVWNIYKQNRSNWRRALNKFSADKQLVLLQEASMGDELKAWINQGKWNGNQVDAFKAFDKTAGVLNLAPQLPVEACAYTELEPWIRLPKSALYATYQLSNGAQLAVVNIHAVNFTYGTKEYRRQLNTLTEALMQHPGPVIIAGDFNSWSKERLQVMRNTLEMIGVHEVSYLPDHRKQFINGLPLDHVFYKGLKFEKAEAPSTDASDHNPLMVQFSL
ncbi:endonuclease/exonuclease/phosphatase family protein [Vibrio sp. V39_P1S14PM300]|uniref:endonuclease/exonuclease/phosphatase family protein n=1 Tax=Vibrio sp. V39_P1S14PM300 TaxID=1938690 RepID=UPI001372A575|nr:endonuclease/exonuclease/phosphatase family protein [Vibrio sp. V39_P1S14PM300]NAX22273.1 endonuclease/exonuclease/phosphatase family protein [Vibrio sp. V39_P1S14PM300]